MTLRLLMTTLFGLACASALAQSPAPAPKLSAAEAIQLVEASGMTLAAGNKVVNRCGTHVNPRIAFVDLNGDGRAEAHVADVDPRCYGKPGAWFAILARNGNGRWVRLIGEDGITGFGPGRTRGWVDLVLTPADSACPGTRRFDGRIYPTPAACRPGAPPATAKAPSPAKPSPSARAGGGLPLDRGFYVETGTPCGRASNATLALLTRGGLRFSRSYCDFDRIEQTGPTSWRVAQTCGDFQDGGENGESKATAVWEIRSRTAFSFRDDAGWSHSARFCPQKELPAPWRTNDIRDIVQ